MRKLWVIWSWLILTWLISLWSNEKINLDTVINFKEKINNIIPNKRWDVYENIVVFDNSDGLDYSYDIEYFPNSEQDQILERLKNIVSIYPDFLTEKISIRKIFILKSIKNKKWEEIGGFAKYWKIYLNWSSTNLNKFHHEFFHLLDNKNSGDDLLWTNQFNNNKNTFKDFSSESNTEVEWYANLYWKSWWENEDQATIAEYLLNSSKKQKLLIRAKSDRVLQKKIILMTWCYFDEKIWIFTRDLSKEEYKQMLHSDDYEYFSKWWRKDWTLYMNYEFWNKI